MNGASLALAARIVLAVVLAASAIAKLRVARARSRAQVDDRRWATARRAADRAACCPAVELVVAVALVAWWSPVPGIVAVVLLAVFTVVLVRAAGAARAVPVLRVRRASSAGRARAIVRNGVLAALAVFAIGDPAAARSAGDGRRVAVFGVVAAVADARRPLIDVAAVSGRVADPVVARDHAEVDAGGRGDRRRRRPR